MKSHNKFPIFLVRQKKIKSSEAGGEVREDREAARLFPNSWISSNSCNLLLPAEISAGKWGFYSQYSSIHPAAAATTTSTPSPNTQHTRVCAHTHIYTSRCTSPSHCQIGGRNRCAGITTARARVCVS